jgi:DNA invertase Pin-like site-specific DNA recombinase
MRLGYVRINADTPIRGPEIKLFDEASCNQVLADALSGSRHHVSPACLARIEALSEGDELVVLQLDHLAPMPELLSLLYKLTKRGIVVRSLADGFDTGDERTTKVFAVLGRYANAEPQARRSTGRHRALDDVTMERARRMIVDDKISVAEVAKRLNVSRSTIYRNVRLTASKRVPV